MVLRFTCALCIASLIGCAAAKPVAVAPTPQMVEVHVEGVPGFAVRKAAMEGSFGQLVNAARAVLAIAPPPPAPADDAPEAARKAWVATEYLPYLQAHVEAYGKVVAQLRVLPQGSLREQTFASAVLGWIAERHGRVLARAPHWKDTADDTADPFAQARTHYGACIDDASHAAQAGETAASFEQLLAFCRQHLEALPDPAQRLHTWLEHVERGRPAPPPRWVNVPEAAIGATQAPPEHAVALSVDAGWVAFDAIRAHADAEAVPKVIEQWLKHRADSATHAASNAQAAGDAQAAGNAQAASGGVDVLVFADRGMTLGAAAPVLAAVAGFGRAWLAFAREPVVATAPEVAGAPEWYSSWRARWREAAAASGERRQRVLLLREAWMQVVGACGAGRSMADALVEAPNASKWAAFGAPWKPQSGETCCVCDEARDVAVAPVVGGLLELTAHTLRGPRVGARRVQFAENGSLPVGPDASFADLATALSDGDAPLIWPARWAVPPS